MCPWVNLVNTFAFASFHIHGLQVEFCSCAARFGGSTVFALLLSIKRRKTTFSQVDAWTPSRQPTKKHEFRPSTNIPIPQWSLSTYEEVDYLYFMPAPWTNTCPGPHGHTRTRIITKYTKHFRINNQHRMVGITNRMRCHLCMIYGAWCWAHRQQTIWHTSWM